MRLARRRLRLGGTVPAFLALLAQPASVQGPAPQCAALRAITNADSRDFADLRIAPGHALTVDGLSDDAFGFPLPENCVIGVTPDVIDIACWWPNGGFEAASALFRQLFAQAATCLSATLTPASGPQPHGEARALLESRTRLQFANGATTLRILLVESAGAGPNHYVLLSAEHEIGATSGEE